MVFLGVGMLVRIEACHVAGCWLRGSDGGFDIFCMLQSMEEWTIMMSSGGYLSRKALCHV